MTTPAPEIRIVNERRISCDGQQGPLGHPRIWLQIPLDTGHVDCPYCDAQFQYQDS